MAKWNECLRIQDELARDGLNAHDAFVGGAPLATPRWANLPEITLFFVRREAR